MITSSSKKIWALALLSIVVGAYGCTSSSSESEEEEDAPGESQDELAMRRGSVDHAAIVESTTMMLVGEITDFATVLDPYNQDDPFAIRGNAFAGGFKRNLLKFDAYDQHTDWTPAQMTTWISRMSTGNYQVVDTSKPCDYRNPHTYLEIERAQMTGRAHTTCGGRMPNEDALDVTINFLARGPAASALDENAIHDGVEQATKQASDAFPYLGEMNGF